MQIQAIAFRACGAPDVLESLSVEIPDAPPPGHVRVRVAAVALNHLDLWVRRGLPHLKLELPHRLGSDVVGTIEAVGAGQRSPVAAPIPEIGAKVVVSPGISCGACEACLGGRDTLCRKYAILGENTHGGYAELLDVPAANLLPDRKSVV